MTAGLLEHHRRALDAFLDEVRSKDLFQAVILTGSVAQGRARPDSDLDAYLVVSEDEYAERLAGHDLAYLAPLDYEGGYVDGKVVSRTFLEAAAERGSEPTRASFGDAQVVFSRIGDLQPLVDSISRYPEGSRQQSITDFYCYVLLHGGYFAPAALRKGDPFLLQHAVTSMTLYAGRLLLAHNRELFPCPKQLLESLGRCTELPDGFVEATTGLLAAPTLEAVNDYLRLVVGFTDWGVPQELVLTRFMELDEWSWFSGVPSVAQR